MVNSCFLCKEEEGFINHILLYCSLVKILWQLLFDLFGVHWVQVAMVKEALLGWPSSFMGRRRKKVWRVAPLNLFWTFERREISKSFENKEHFVHFLKIFFLEICFLG